MYIKLNLQGELLELLQEESKEEFRSPTQHVMFILNKHFKDRKSYTKETLSVDNKQEVTTIHQKELLVPNGENVELINQKEELIVNNKTQISAQEEQDEFDYISDEMLNF